MKMTIFVIWDNSHYSISNAKNFALQFIFAENKQKLVFMKIYLIEGIMRNFYFCINFENFNLIKKLINFIMIS